MTGHAGDFFLFRILNPYPDLNLYDYSVTLVFLLILESILRTHKSKKQKIDHFTLEKATTIQPQPLCAKAFIEKEFKGLSNTFKLQDQVIKLNYLYFICRLSKGT